VSGTHVAIDHVVVPILIAWATAERLWIYPWFVRRIASGAPGARKQLYWSVLAPEWGLTAAILWLWRAQGRAWAALFLGISAPMPRFAIGMALAAAMVALLVHQRRTVLARPELLEVVRRKIANSEALVPHAQDERGLFAALSVTAGVCEEIIFRGFLIWYFWVWTGPWWALLISSAIFGFGHIYQGIRQVPKTGTVGAVLGGVVLLAGSLWPAMILHAALDLNSGDLGYHAFRAAAAGSSPSFPSDTQSDQGGASHAAQA
jgi:uncharacterized protein